jgi:hypothetical protein
MAHIRQSRPDFGLGFQVKVLQPVEGVASSSFFFVTLGLELSDTQVYEP